MSDYKNEEKESQSIIQYYFIFVQVFECVDAYALNIAPRIYH